MQPIPAIPHWTTPLHCAAELILQGGKLRYGWPHVTAATAELTAARWLELWGSVCCPTTSRCQSALRRENRPRLSCVPGVGWAGQGSRAKQTPQHRSAGKWTPGKMTSQVAAAAAQYATTKKRCRTPKLLDPPNLHWDRPQPWHARGSRHRLPPREGLGPLHHCAQLQPSSSKPQQCQAFPRSLGVSQGAGAGSGRWPTVSEEEKLFAFLLPRSLEKSPHAVPVASCREELEKAF